jgi:hypothetical protein
VKWEEFSCWKQGLIIGSLLTTTFILIGSIIINLVPSDSKISIVQLVFTIPLMLTVVIPEMLNIEIFPFGFLIFSFFVIGLSTITGCIIGRIKQK